MLVQIGLSAEYKCNMSSKHLNIKLLVCIFQRSWPLVVTFMYIHSLSILPQATTLPTVVSPRGSWPLPTLTSLSTSRLLTTSRVGVASRNCLLWLPPSLPPSLPFLPPSPRHSSPSSTPITILPSLPSSHSRWSTYSKVSIQVDPWGMTQTQMCVHDSLGMDYWMVICTVEPQNKGHYVANNFVPFREVRM